MGLPLQGVRVGAHKKMKKHPNLIVTIKIIPHPNPRQAIDLAANLFLKNFSNELEQAKT